MIWYFTGTGNSRWVAEEVARKTGDEARSLIGAGAPGASLGEVFGLVFPIHAWSVPRVVSDFLAGLSGKPQYAFAICTCGEYAGMAMDDLKGRFDLDSIWSVSLPSNYILGRDLEPEGEILEKFRRAEEQTGEIARHILSRDPVTAVHRGTHPRLKTSLLGKGFQAGGRSTRPFQVTEHCTSCGLCERECPAGAIELVEGLPRWTLKSCFHCTACINRCPVEAIEYGSRTRGRRRYRIEDYIPPAG